MTTAKTLSSLNDAHWSQICDAHCHPHDDTSNLEAIPKVKTGCLTIMGTKESDWPFVERVVEICEMTGCPQKVVPCFGIHPWYAHLIQSSTEHEEHYSQILTAKSREDVNVLLETLPAPTPFSVWSGQLRELLKQYPRALVGEIGLDKSARLMPPGTIHWAGVIPTSVQCTMDHQTAIFESQLDIAREFGRGVSVHCVQAYGQLLSLLQGKVKEWDTKINERGGRKRKGGKKAKEYEEAVRRTLESEDDEPKSMGEKKYLRPLRLCVHSYGGSEQMLQSLFKLPQRNLEIYISFSIAINSRLGERLAELIRAVPEERLLIESDLDSPKMLDNYMHQIVEKVSETRGWSVDEVVEKTWKNWRRFVNEKEI